MLRHWPILASLLIAVSCSIEDPDAGKGLLVLSPGTRANFAQYMGQDAPLYFRGD